MADSIDDIIVRELGIIKSSIAGLGTTVVATAKSRGVQRGVWIGLIVLFLALAALVFFRTKPTNTSAIDDRIRLRDSIDASKRQTIELLEKQRDQLLVENSELKSQQRLLEDQYISNQEKHVIINQKKNEISPDVRALNLDSLRSEFLRTH